MNVQQLFIIVLLMFASVSCSKKNDPINNVRSEMLGLVNELRGQGCYCGGKYMPPAKALKWNTILENAADLHASDMYFKNYFDHIGLDGSSPIGRAKQVGYKGTYVGENIARGYRESASVVNAWRNSKDHCKAMMDTLYIEMGVSKSGTYWVQELGR